MVEQIKSSVTVANGHWTARTRVGISKDTLDIKKTNLLTLPLKSCIQISSPDGTKLNVKKAKSVHFADSLGKPLKSIKTLCGLEDDLDLAFLGLCSAGNFTIKRTFPAKQRSQSQKCKFVNFSLPTSSYNFMERINSENVLLESLIFRDYGIFGTVNVKNISFEKEVYVTFTLDNWVTVQKTEAKYVPGSSTGSIDIFSFEINVSDEKKDNCEIQFAICYKTGPVSYWDSNNSQNYKVSFNAEKSSSKKSFLDNNYNGFIIPKQNFIGWAS